MIFTLLSLNSSWVAANYKWRLVIKSNNLYLSTQLNQIKQILFGIYKGRKWQKMLKFSFNARKRTKALKSSEITRTQEPKSIWSYMPKTRTLSVCFILMRITDEHGTHRFYDVLRYPPSQPRLHCAFPWILVKLRWTQAIVTAVSHFLVQNRVRILRTGQHTPTRGTPRETSNLVASLPVSTHLLIIRCFNALW